MIKRLYVNNYKNLVNFELRLGELTLLLGGNGSGKSSVLDVLYALREMLSGSTKVADPTGFSSQTLTRWQSVPVQVFELDVDIPEAGELSYRLEVEHDKERGLARVALERLSAPEGPLFEFEKGTVRLYRDDHTPGPSFSGDWSESWLARFSERRTNPRPTHFLQFVRKIVICSTYPPGILSESRGEASLLARDASNFASWYRGVLQDRPDLLVPYLTAVGQAVPGLTWLRLEAVGQDARSLVASFDDYGSEYTLGLDELSDGQKALIVLYALLHFPVEQGYTVLIDEPDNYLALAEIQPWLMALSDAAGDTVSQALLCSHHPEMIDYLGAEHGVLLDRDSSGPVVAKSLSDRAEVGGLRLSEVIARGWER